MRKAFVVVNVLFVLSSVHGVKSADQGHSLPTLAGDSGCASAGSLVCRDANDAPMIRAVTTLYTPPQTPPNSTLLSGNPVFSDNLEELVRLYAKENYQLLKNIQALYRESNKINIDGTKVIQNLDKGLLRSAAKLAKKLHVTHDVPSTPQRIVVPLEQAEYLLFLIKENQRLSNRVDILRRRIKLQRTILQVLEACNVLQNTDVAQNCSNLREMPTPNQQESSSDEPFSEYISWEPVTGLNSVHFEQKDS